MQQIIETTVWLSRSVNLIVNMKPIIPAIFLIIIIDILPSRQFSFAMSSQSMSQSQLPAFSVCHPVRWSALLHSTLLSSSTQNTRSNSDRISTCLKASATIKPPTATDSEARAAKIVCIGDVHGQWGESDELALLGLQPDLALFVGDYGNEDLRVTSRIASFASRAPFQVATVFGNHDAFYTAYANKRHRHHLELEREERNSAPSTRVSNRKYTPSTQSNECKVKQQMEMLSPYDVSYRAAPVENISLSVIGGRPFSFGGPNWKNASFYRKYMKVSSLSDSASKIANAVTTSDYKTLIFLSHSGPIGLGCMPNDPCGKDWGSQPGGDYGDADLRHAIDEARTKGYFVPLTVFGHMHKQLQAGFGERIMLKSECDNNGRRTVMLNAAVVPRHRQVMSSTSGSRSASTLHHFSIVRMKCGGGVESVEEAWVASDGTVIETSVMFNDSDPSTFNDILETSSSVASNSLSSLFSSRSR